MRWSEIVSMTMDILQRDSNNVRNFNANSALRAFGNKALNTIANKHLPNIAMFDITTGDEYTVNVPIRMPSDFLSHNGMTHYY